MSSLDDVTKYVRNLQEGRIKEEDAKEVITLLKGCWELLKCTDDTSLYFHKLDRVENLTFFPPATITFEIERHGPTALGCVYADLHYWEIDLEEGSAYCNPYYGKRVVGERAKPLKVEPIAKEITQQIINLNKKSKSVDWKSDKKVRVLMREVIPETNQQTTAARRKRFRKKLEELLLPHGWYPTAAYNVYEKRGK